MKNLAPFIVGFVTHLFVIATGFAALLHSTWALAVMFNRHEPVLWSGDWWAWVIPAFVFAFAIDAGQIATSVELRRGERTRAKYATFAALAAATYFLQWWYLVHHMPLQELADGVRGEWREAAALMSDSALWIVPGLLPLTTILYTFSYAQPKRIPQRKVAQTVESPVASEIAVPAVLRVANVEPAKLPAGEYVVQCPQCEWHKAYETQRGATNALVAHRRHRHSKVRIDA